MKIAGTSLQNKHMREKSMNDNSKCSMVNSFIVLHERMVQLEKAIDDIYTRLPYNQHGQPQIQPGREKEHDTGGGSSKDIKKG